MAKNTGGPKTGTVVKTRDGRWQGVITLADGTRKRLKPYALGTSKAMAKEKTAHWAEKYAAAGVVGENQEEPSAGGPGWWHAYQEHRKAKGLTPVDTMYEAHLKPVLAAKHPRDWTKADCERVRDSLDEKIKAGTWKSERRVYKFGWKRAWNVWALFTSACKEASSSKNKALRVRDDNPCAGVLPPDRGSTKIKQWLHPTEFQKLVSCDEVPIRWLTLYTVLTYSYVRPNELKALRRKDIELDTGLINVTKAWDFAENQPKSYPKSKAGVRYVPIEAELLGLLRQLCDVLEPDDYLFPTLPPAEDWADTFRVHLRRAGVDREARFEDTETVKNITLYDLRATGITWRTLRRDDTRVIQAAAGHEKYATTEGYVRAAEVFRGRVGDPFPPLPKEFRSRVTIARSASVGKQSGKVASPRGFEPLLQP
jgi:integrase